MSKYNELVVKYAGQIAVIKTLKATADALTADIETVAKQYEDEPDGDYRAFVESRDLIAKASDAQNEYCIALDRLTQDIEGEYWEVPFAKARIQGKDAFWRATGL